MRLKTWLMTGAALLGSSLAGADGVSVTFDGAEFVRKVSQLQVAYGRPPLTEPLRVTPKERKALLDKADVVCRGSAYFYGTEAVPIGERGIDWLGGQKRHQEWVAQLNRFTMLEPLGAAYRLSGDEAYAARAATVMADWCDFWDRHERRFIDPQNNNVLNVSIRIRAWLTALAIFLESPSFTPALVERLVGVLAQQSEMLTERTRPGDSNWQIAQAHALLEAGLALDFMPGAERWRTAGVTVLNACFARQFRADGSHVENTTGYHGWMVDVLIYAWQLNRLRPDLGLQADPEMIRKGLCFRQLGAPFAFNDSKYAGSFPRWPQLRLAPVARRGGIADWQPPQFGVFPDAGLVFGGHATEKFFFDAGQFGGWHTHLSRLTVEYGAYGHNLLVDPAITSYERSDYHFAFGRTTRSHATVHFNGAHQLRAGAELLDAVLSERFAVAVGSFAQGAIQGDFTRLEPANVKAEMQRTVLWLADEFMLLFDRTRFETAPTADRLTGYVFPSAPAEKWEWAVPGSAWRTVNRRTPNLLIQMVLKPAPEVAASCAEGQREPVLRGWIGTTRADMIPAPTVEFIADTGSEPAHAVTLLAAAAAGIEVPACQVETARPGHLDFRRGDSPVYQLRYSPYFRQSGTLQAAGATAEATLLLRHGQRCFVYRATALTLDGISRRLPATPYTGWVE